MMNAKEFHSTGIAPFTRAGVTFRAFTEFDIAQIIEQAQREVLDDWMNMTTRELLAKYNALHLLSDSEREGK